jgi:hypothetical protein
LNKGDLASRELDSTHSKSPMNPFKGYKKWELARRKNNSFTLLVHK